MPFAPVSKPIHRGDHLFDGFEICWKHRLRIERIRFQTAFPNSQQLEKWSCIKVRLPLQLLEHSALTRFRLLSHCNQRMPEEREETRKRFEHKLQYLLFAR